jgi:hypothetical protein
VSSEEEKQESKEGGRVSSEMTSQWAEIIGQLFDRLTGKGATVTYTFDNLVVEVPKARGPSGQDLGSAKWTVNGKVVITAEAHETTGERPRMAASA